MSKIFRVIIPLVFCAKVILGSEVKSIANVFPNTTVFTSSNDTTLNIDETRNRFPEILRDAKLLMSETIISDYNNWVNGLIDSKIHPNDIYFDTPEEGVEKNEEPAKDVSDDFDFNQDNLLEDNEEYRSPGWARLKKKLLK